MKEFKPVIIGLCFVVVFILGFSMGKLEIRQQKSHGEPTVEPKFSYNETINEVKEVDSQQYNWDNNKRKYSKNLNNYSDEEIRILREKQSFKSDGGYINTPGRHVPDN